ncbi:patatin-like phospholipase family protein [Afipia massiliensis]|uniref:Patatin-like phospholipase family protein n=2 Tax=Afipia massiliensis TaxID=211460 RepID=A0A4U6BQR6_9BRAD|nr:patatin-like phospholipase family protein [Afipia massiliensis]TKT72847.1 patatin-like phospholipase family protein [Afipia massiliensis]
MRWVRPLACVMFVSGVLLGCASIQNAPVNLPGSDNLTDRGNIGFGETTSHEDTVVGLSFSGGGTRAAAFSFGVLQEMERIPVRGARGSMIDRVEFISGVSGGSVTAAYYGLRKRAALADFRERFLLRNAEEGLQTNLTLATLSRAVAGGINDSTGFPRWLDANLFQGATFRDLGLTTRPQVWINASDIYNRTPFVFGSVAFGAMCSNLSEYPLANAVAASAAVPVAFAPVVIQTFPGKCNDRLPSWIVRARDNSNAPPMLNSFAKAISRYHDGSMPYIKLLDGGLVDNYGLAGMTIARLSSDTPYGPLSPRQAVKLRRALILVVDAKTGLSGNWINTIEGPSGADLVKAAADTAIDASVAGSFTAFNATMMDWQGSLIRWRCGLSAADRAKYGVGPGWNCRDLKFYVGRIGFDQLDQARAADLERIPTRFQLPPEQVDSVIAAGGDALRASPTFRSFAAGL